MGKKKHKKRYDEDAPVPEIPESPSLDPAADDTASDDGMPVADEDGE